MIAVAAGWLIFLKWFWTIASGIGVVVTGTLFAMAINDYQFLINNKLNGWRRQVAKTSILIYMGGFGTQIIYFVIGIISLITTSKLPADYHPPGRQYISSALLVVGAVSSIILAIVIYLRRRNILEVIEKSLRDQIARENEQY